MFLNTVLCPSFTENVALLKSGTEDCWEGSLTFMPLTFLIGFPQLRSYISNWEQVSNERNSWWKTPERSARPPHSCVPALPRPGIPQPFPVPRPQEPVTRTQSVSALYFPAASASPSGFCKVFPVDLADGLCWHVAKSAKNITICWPLPRPGFVFVWT